jgi:predicted lipid-binding transport protein (Tim44 family)
MGVHVVGEVFFAGGVWNGTFSGVASGLILLALTLIGRKVWTEVRDAKGEREQAALAAYKAQQDRDEIRDALLGPAPTPFQPIPPPGLIQRVATLETDNAARGDQATRIEELLEARTARFDTIEHKFDEVIDTLDNGLRSDVRMVISEQERMREVIATLTSTVSELTA